MVFKTTFLDFHQNLFHKMEFYGILWDNLFYCQEKFYAAVDKKKNDYSGMSATDKQKVRFQTAMVKAAVQIVCKEKGLDTPKDIDKLAKFIVLEKGFDYGCWDICRKDDLPYIISDFLGEAVWATKITENDDDGTAKLLVKIKDNVWQVDFKDFCKNGAADLSVEKLEKCEDKIDKEIKSFIIIAKRKIENILKDFEEHKSNKEKQGLVNVEKDNIRAQTSTHISKKTLPQTTEPKNGRSVCDLLFGRWPKEYFAKGVDSNIGTFYYINNKENDKFKNFHACTQPEINR